MRRQLLEFFDQVLMVERVRRRIVVGDAMVNGEAVSDVLPKAFAGFAVGSPGNKTSDVS